jgi:hypothetical protein
LTRRDVPSGSRQRAATVEVELPVATHVVMSGAARRTHNSRGDTARARRRWLRARAAEVNTFARAPQPQRGRGTGPCVGARSAPFKFRWLDIAARRSSRPRRAPPSGTVTGGPRWPGPKRGQPAQGGLVAHLAGRGRHGTGAVACASGTRRRHMSGGVTPNFGIGGAGVATAPRGGCDGPLRPPDSAPAAGTGPLGTKQCTTCRGLIQPGRPRSRDAGRQALVAPF